jgi:hypothetical protein
LRLTERAAVRVRTGRRPGRATRAARAARATRAEHAASGRPAVIGFTRARGARRRSRRGKLR